MVFTSNKYIINILIIFAISVLLIFAARFLDGGRAMVIVEPREHKMLKYVCENFHKNMCKSWDMYVFHGKTHGEHAKDATENIKGRKVFLIPLEKDNYTADDYNYTFKSLDFWNKVKAENILVFQTDAVLCPASKYKIKDFMNFDYIGCGSFNNAIGNSINSWGKDPSSRNYNFYGIGGLSFRKNSFQKQCIKHNPNVDPKFAEDVFYSECVAKSINKPKSARDLANFCTQDNFASKSFGAHKTTYMKNGHSEPFYQFCPAARAIKKE